MPRHSEPNKFLRWPSIAYVVIGMFIATQAFPPLPLSALAISEGFYEHSHLASLAVQLPVRRSAMRLSDGFRGSCTYPLRKRVDKRPIRIGGAPPVGETYGGLVSTAASA
jgi:hypothetical protein